MAKVNRSVDAAHVSFRITNPAVAELLSERAHAAGASPNLVARELCTAALARDDHILAYLSRIEGTLRDMESRLEQLDLMQRYLERGLELLFRHAGRLSAVQARTMMERYVFEHPTSAAHPHALDQEDGTRQ